MGTMQDFRLTINTRNLKMRTTFKELNIHTVFYFGGTKWVKQSSRTAHVYGTPSRFFYFGMKEQVRKEKH